jgi:hypothetical protein
MSNCVAFVIDGTTHPITRVYLQERYYRNDKSCHFRQTMLLVAFEGKIIRFYWFFNFSVVTNIPGKYQDNLSVKYHPLFDKVLKESNSYAISDSKFYNCDNVVVGYSQPQLKRKKEEISNEPSNKRKKFDRIARVEQKKIEHVNNFLKKYACLNHIFKESELKHSYIIMIVSGLYNWRFEHGHYQNQ